MQQLDKLRQQIDRIDRTIITLLEERIKKAQEVAVIKNANNLPLTDLNREQAIIDKLKSSTKNIVLKDYLTPIYQNIFALSKTIRIMQKKDPPPFTKIGILGLGLIGGSIAQALKAKNSRLLIYTLKRQSESNREVYEKRFIDKEMDTLDELLEKTELLILATPIDQTIPLAKQIFEAAKKINKHRIIVIDVASVKQKITQAFEKLTDDRAEFVPTHPMAGSQKTGFKASSSVLFVGQPWIITPHAKTSTAAIEKISQMVKYLGSHPKIISAVEHDTLVATVSHLVFLISTYLLAYASQNPKSLELAGSGFKSMTRLASGNPLMHGQIFAENIKNIDTELTEFLKFIQKNRLKKNKSLEFFQKFKKIRDEFID